MAFPAQSPSSPDRRIGHHTLDGLTPDGEVASPAQMIFSILEGVYSDYLSASFDNAKSRRGDIEQLSQYGGNFSDITRAKDELYLTYLKLPDDGS